MPKSPKTRCPTCHQPTTPPCPTCTPPWTRRPPTWTPTHKKNPRWRTLRKQILHTQPWCTHCGHKATHIDHLDDTDYSDHTGTGNSWLNPEKCQPLCATCHQTRTAHQGNTAKKKIKNFGIPPQ